MAAYDAVIQQLLDNEIVKGKFLSPDGTLAILDVRERSEWEERRIPGAAEAISGELDRIEIDLLGQLGVPT